MSLRKQVLTSSLQDACNAWWWMDLLLQSWWVLEWEEAYHFKNIEGLTEIPICSGPTCSTFCPSAGWERAQSIWTRKEEPNIPGWERKQALGHLSQATNKEFTRFQKRLLLISFWNLHPYKPWIYSKFAFLNVSYTSIIIWIFDDSWNHTFNLKNLMIKNLLFSIYIIMFMEIT